jgi:hypothetical protein
MSTYDHSTYEDATKHSFHNTQASVNKRVRFWAGVADDVDYPSKTFQSEVDHYLHDPAGWTAKGVEFILAPRDPDVTFILVPDRPSLFGLSLSHPGHGFVEVNAANWVNGVQRTRLSLDGYRQYLISHEMGHMLGHEHSNPHAHGQPVPVMHQQSRLGVEGFQPNNKVDPKVNR